MRRASRALLTATATGGLLLSALAGAQTALATSHLLTAGAAGAAAVTAADARYAFALADRPTAASYVANPRMSANSSGGINSIVRHGTGDYSVTLPGMGADQGGNAQVSAYGGGARCKTAYWLPLGSNQVVGVLCDDSAGRPADSAFTVQYYRAAAGQTQQSAYVQASWTGDNRLIVDSRYSYSSKGTNTVTRDSQGRFTVRFGGFTTLGGIVHVTATGFSTNYCKVRGWSTSAASVSCFTPAGQPVDTSWSLRYTDRHLPNGFAELGGYAWANNPSAVGTYNPDPRHSFNMQSGEVNRVQHNSVGRYSVTFPRIPAFDAGTPVATAHGSGAATCSVTELFSSGSGSRVDVECRTPQGALTDSAFTVSQATNY
jgi:hypothetical protein